jgi:hypothetical protein
MRRSNCSRRSLGRIGQRVRQRRDRLLAADAARLVGRDGRQELAARGVELRPELRLLEPQELALLGEEVLAARPAPA